MWDWAGEARQDIGISFVPRPGRMRILQPPYISVTSLLETREIIRYSASLLTKLSYISKVNVCFPYINPVMRVATDTRFQYECQVKSVLGMSCAAEFAWLAEPRRAVRRVNLKFAVRSAREAGWGLTSTAGDARYGFSRAAAALSRPILG